MTACVFTLSTIIIQRVRVWSYSAIIFFFCNIVIGRQERGHSSFCLISLTPSIITFVGIKIGYLQGVYELTTRPHGKNDDVDGMPKGRRRGLLISCLEFLIIPILAFSTLTTNPAFHCNVLPYFMTSIPFSSFQKAFCSRFNNPISMPL